ncbi:MAG: AmmeMemoRadiSam system radical SAM enzyme [Candidatus Bathyarchaeia archaeon]
MTSRSPSLHEITSLRVVREARLYESLVNGRAQCFTCERRCIVKEDGWGFCKTRKNIKGCLYTVIYGDLSSVSINPIEKKPFFHYKPGSLALTIGSWGCNFTCPWCQNHEISKTPPSLNDGNYVNPWTLVERALEGGCDGTSVSFNEPTLQLEYSLDLFHLAKSRGLYNTYVSNGYMTPEALKMLKDAGLDAVKIDLKGGCEAVRKYCGADVEKVWRNINLARSLGLHVEVVCLIIPGVNDNQATVEEVCSRLSEMDEEIPLHFTRFHPEYQMTDRPSTPVKTLERAVEAAYRHGLKYVYLGNVPGHRYENTYCPECGGLLIARQGFTVLKNRLSGNRCPRCGCRIPLIGPVKISTALW